jgi:hypothetical protein
MQASEYSTCACSPAIDISKGKLVHSYTVHSLINRNTTVTAQLLAGTAWLTAKCYKIFPMWVKYFSIKTIKSTNLHCKRCWKWCPYDSWFLSQRTVFVVMDMCVTIKYGLLSQQLSLMNLWLQNSSPATLNAVGCIKSRMFYCCI